MASNKGDYSQKVVLGPMVRVGTLAFRLLSLDYGADLAYSEEIIDYKLLKCRRIVNDLLGTVDFIDDDHSVVFRTCHLEKEKVILQLGTSDPDRALRAAQMVENDVAGIDINMGCPKQFSLKGGMGAALLTQPAKIEAILKTLVKNQPLPVTCKIRVLENLEDTMNLVKLIESCGVCALAIHGRTVSERPQHKNRDEFIAAAARELKIPVIANGGSSEILSYQEIEKFRQKTMASSVMLSRAAEKNCSIFRKQGFEELNTVIRAYLLYCIRYDNHFTNTKYTIQQMLGSLQETPFGKRFLSSQQLKDICDLWNMSDQYRQCLGSLKMNVLHVHAGENESGKESCHKKLRVNSDQEPIIMSIKYIKNFFEENKFPKSLLLNYARNSDLELPNYKTIQVDKHFYSIAHFDDKEFRNYYLEKNKRFAEQGAALVVCCKYNLVDKHIISECLVEESPKEMAVHLS